MLFRTPQITEREAEVIGEIESIRRQLNLPRLREWPGLPWRAIHDRILQASKNPALGTVLIENAGGAEDEEPGAENPDAWSAAPDFAIDEGTIRALHYMMAGHDPEKAPGRWRRESISVKEDSSGKAMYKTPHAKFIPALMAELIASLRRLSRASMNT